MTAVLRRAGAGLVRRLGDYALVVVVAGFGAVVAVPSGADPVLWATTGLALLAVFGQIEQWIELQDWTGGRHRAPDPP